MPSRGHSGIHSSEACSQWAPVCVQGWLLPDPRQAGLCHPKSADRRRYKYNGVLRTQFSDWGCHYSSRGRSRRFNHKNARQVGIFSIPEISPHTKRDASCNLGQTSDPLVVVCCQFHLIGFQNQNLCLGGGSATLGLCMFGLDGCGCEKQRQPQIFDYDIPQQAIIQSPCIFPYPHNSDCVRGQVFKCYRISLNIRARSLDSACIIIVILHSS